MENALNCVLFYRAGYLLFLLFRFVKKSILFLFSKTFSPDLIKFKKFDLSAKVFQMRTIPEKNIF